MTIESNEYIKMIKSRLPILPGVSWEVRLESLHPWETGYNHRMVISAVFNSDELNLTSLIEVTDKIVGR